MNTQLTYTADATVGPTAVAQALAVLKLIPIDLTLLRIWGLLAISDTIGNISTAMARTIVTQMTPTIADAAGTAVLGGTANATVQSVTMTNQGGLYGAPPIVTFTGGNPTLRPDGVPLAAQGFANCQVRGCNVLLGGSGYSGATIVTFVGPLAPGGVAATGTVTVVGNAVTGITMVTTGGPYLQAPAAVISDTGGGTGAEVVAGLSVSSVTVTYPGVGYQAAPTVVFTPYFKAMVPDSAGDPNQIATLQGWMDGEIQKGLNIPVISRVSVA